MAKVRFSAPKGMRDVMPDDLAVFRHIESVFRETCRLFAFREIRTPHLESTDLFCRTVGETTDIVEKEMYSLETKGGDRLSLRPENTAGVVRAYLEHGLHRTAPLQKLYYFGEQFRHESAQKKRYREFTQAGVELIGSEDPEADVDVISLAVEFFKRLGLGDVRVEINSFGCPKCRPAFREALFVHFKGREGKLCADCRRRLDANVFRLLDCKEEGCRAIAEQAPTIRGYLDADCQNHYNKVRDGLDVLNHYDPDTVPYKQNGRLVRGLDYYNRTVFEIFPASSSGRQDALGAGGRYDGLAELLGGPPVPAVGFALGVDRIMLELPGGFSQQVRVHVAPVFYQNVPQDKAGQDALRNVARVCLAKLRAHGVAAECLPKVERPGKKMTQARKRGATHILFLGGDELAAGNARLQNLSTKDEIVVSLADIGEAVAKALPQLQGG